MIYNHQKNWILLILLVCVGAFTRHAMVTKNRWERFTLVPAIAALAALLAFTNPQRSNSALTITPIEWKAVSEVLQRRCLSCHSTHPTDDVFKIPPNGIIFESENQFRERAEKIRLHVVSAKTMPLGNKTQMTEKERALIELWLNQLNLGQ